MRPYDLVSTGPRTYDDDFSFLTLASVLRKKVDRMRNTKLSLN